MGEYVDEDVEPGTTARRTLTPSSHTAPGDVCAMFVREPVKNLKIFVLIELVLFFITL